MIVWSFCSGFSDFVVLLLLSENMLLFSSGVLVVFEPSLRCLVWDWFARRLADFRGLSWVFIKEPNFCPTNNHHIVTRATATVII